MPLEAKGLEERLALIVWEVQEGLVAIRELAEVTSVAWIKQEEI